MEALLRQTHQALVETCLKWREWACLLYLVSTHIRRDVLISEVLDKGEVDTWIKTGDQEAFNMSRRLIRSEGILCGGTSGAAVVAALKVAKQFRLAKDKTIVVILADGVRDYIWKVCIHLVSTE